VLQAPQRRAAAAAALGRRLLCAQQAEQEGEVVLRRVALAKGRGCDDEHLVARGELIHGAVKLAARHDALDGVAAVALPLPRADALCDGAARVAALGAVDDENARGRVGHA